jgi:hypothetical protein
MNRQHRHARRFPRHAADARRLASDIIESCAAEVDREYSLVSTWALISEIWPAERKSVMREVIYRRYSWY